MKTHQLQIKRELVFKDLTREQLDEIDQFMQDVTDKHPGHAIVTGFINFETGEAVHVSVCQTCKNKIIGKSFVLKPKIS